MLLSNLIHDWVLSMFDWRKWDTVTTDYVCVSRYGLFVLVSCFKITTFAILRNGTRLTLASEARRPNQKIETSTWWTAHVTWRQFYKYIRALYFLIAVTTTLKILPQKSSGKHEAWKMRCIFGNDDHIQLCTPCIDPAVQKHWFSEGKFSCAETNMFFVDLWR